MDPKERLEAFLHGERPDQIPYTMYYNGWRRNRDGGDWEPLFRAGMRFTGGVATAGIKQRHVERTRTTYETGRKTVTREVMRTPAGEIYRELAYADSAKSGWVQKYWLETPEDYRVMQYIVDNTEVFPNYEAYHQREAEWGDHGIVHASMGCRSPLQAILVDYVGLENLAIHLFDLEGEIEALYSSLLQKLRQRLEIVAAGPGYYVSMLENFTADTMGPQRYARFHMPVYEEVCATLHSAGKILGTHYDGQLSACAKQIAAAPIDLLESLTPPPEGDMTLAQARQAWPTKLFWSNINISLYELPPKQLRAAILERVQEAAPDGRRLAFEISEDMPRNWQESLPVVINALNETRVS